MKGIRREQEALQAVNAWAGISLTACLILSLFAFKTRADQATLTSLVQAAFAAPSLSLAVFALAVQFRPTGSREYIGAPAAHPFKLARNLVTFLALGAALSCLLGFGRLPDLPVFLRTGPLESISFRISFVLGILLWQLVIVVAYTHLFTRLKVEEDDASAQPESLESNTGDHKRILF
jgi:hypothetical protein